MASEPRRTPCGTKPALRRASASSGNAAATIAIWPASTPRLTDLEAIDARGAGPAPGQGDAVSALRRDVARRERAARPVLQEREGVEEDAWIARQRRRVGRREHEPPVHRAIADRELRVRDAQLVRPGACRPEPDGGEDGERERGAHRGIIRRRARRRRARRSSGPRTRNPPRGSAPRSGRARPACARGPSRRGRRRRGVAPPARSGAGRRRWG
jgi:hypothetical protein